MQIISFLLEHCSKPLGGGNQKNLDKNNQWFLRFLFVLFILFLLTALFCLKYSILRYNKSKAVSLPDNIILILGDSQPRCALNPDYIYNSMNFSQNAQNIIFSYYQLKKLIDNGNRPHKVILVYSYRSLADYNINFQQREMLNRYHLILDKNYYNLLYLNGYLDTTLLIRYMVEFLYLPLGISNDLYELLDIRLNHLSGFQFLGMFEKRISHLPLPLSLDRDLGTSKLALKNQRDNYNYLKRDIKDHYYNENGSQPSPLIKQYLIKLAKVCNNNHITLYLINCPIHTEYKKLIPATTKSVTDDFALQLQAKYGITYLNYSEYPLDDEYYYDYCHLNFKGSEIFSQIVNTAICSN